MAINEILLLVNDDVTTPLNKQIYNLMRYVTAENVLHQIVESSTMITSQRTLLDKNMKHAGNLLLKTAVRDGGLKIEIYVNDVLKQTERITTSNTMTLSFEKDDNVKIIVSNYSGTPYIDYMRICGMVTLGDF